MCAPLGFLDFLGPAEILIVGVVAILLFGERLPEVARSFGKQFMEFKKSVQGIRDEFESVARGAISTAERSLQGDERPQEREEATAPKFVPPPSEESVESKAGS